MSNNKRKWEIEYEKFLNGEMDTKLQELEAKVNEKKANREEYEEFKKINKVKENIGKVKNVLELREKLEKNRTEIKEEISRLSDLEKANKEQEKIQKEFEKIDKERARVLKEIKTTKEGKEKAKLEAKLKHLNLKLQENNQQYITNQNIFANNKECKNKKLMGMTKEELENKQFEIGTKISKCNLVANNLMQGKSWDAIEVNLDNWKDRRITSKEKITEKIKSNKKEEIALTVTSKFLEKHPRLAKIINGIKGMWNKVTNRNSEMQSTTTENKENKENKKNIKKDDDFKKYLRDVAEKGMEEVKKEKLTEAKRQAHARETAKFGKDYADKSYKVNDGEER